MAGCGDGTSKGAGKGRDAQSSHSVNLPTRDPIGGDPNAQVSAGNAPGIRRRWPRWLRRIVGSGLFAPLTASALILLLVAGLGWLEIPAPPPTFEQLTLRSGRIAREDARCNGSGKAGCLAVTLTFYLEGDSRPYTLVGVPIGLVETRLKPGMTVDLRVDLRNVPFGRYGDIWQVSQEDQVLLPWEGMATRYAESEKTRQVAVPAILLILVLLWCVTLAFWLPERWRRHVLAAALGRQGTNSPSSRLRSTQPRPTGGRS